MIADLEALIAASVIFAAGASVGWALRGRHAKIPLRRPRCTDYLCEKFRSERCLDGCCRHHCNYQCKCEELTARARANKRWGVQ